MRVAFVVGSFPEISTTFILDQVTGLIDRGHDVQVFARMPDDIGVRHAAVDQYKLIARTRYWLSGWSTPFDVAGRTLRLLSRDPAGTTRALMRSLNLARNRTLTLTLRMWPFASKVLEAPSFDVVLVHFGTNAVVAERLREVGALRGPIVSVFHGYDVSRIVREKGAGYYARVFERGELMLPVSYHFRDRLVELGCPPERIRVHRMGVDTHSFEYLPRALASGQKVQLFTVCRMVEKKGLEFGLRAIAKVLPRFAEFEWHIVGDGPLRARVEALRDELGLAGQVVLHGQKPRAEVQALLRTAHVFFAPSVTGQDGDQEGIPVAIMEAMASGLPVVSTVHTGIPELVRHGESGYLVKEWDVDALADRLVQVMSEPARWQAMGQLGRALVEDQYDVHRLNDGLEKLLAEVVAHSARASVQSSAAR